MGGGDAWRAEQFSPNFETLRLMSSAEKRRNTAAASTPPPSEGAGTPATAGAPVNRPYPSAICTVAAACRTCINDSRVPIAASNSYMIWLPDSVKMSG